MNESHNEQFSKIIRTAIEPIGERELKQDLWHQTQIKLPQTGISVSVFDWALAVLVVILSFLVPEAFFGLLAHL
ncbi:MAG: hypothetical protein WBD16_06825 [Pyrinomonadaceae bacterium]